VKLLEDGRVVRNKLKKSQLVKLLDNGRVVRPKLKKLTRETTQRWSSSYLDLTTRRWSSS